MAPDGLEHFPVKQTNRKDAKTSERGRNSKDPVVLTNANDLQDWMKSRAPSRVCDPSRYRILFGISNLFSWIDFNHRAVRSQLFRSRTKDFLDKSTGNTSSGGNAAMKYSVYVGRVSLVVIVDSIWKDLQLNIWLHLWETR